MAAPDPLARLAGESYINLVTFRRNGRGVETPVWFAIRNRRLYVVTDGTSAKVKRLRATGRIRVAPCTVWGRVTGPWTAGTGRILTGRVAIARAHAALREKYGWQMRLLDAVSTLTGRIGRRAYLELQLAGPEAAAARDDGQPRRRRSRASASSAGSPARKSKRRGVIATAPRRTTGMSPSVSSSGTESQRKRWM